MTPEQPPTPNIPVPETAPNIPTSDTETKPLNINKGVLIAIILVVIAAVIGITALIGFKSSGQYQGFIRKVEQQTEQLKQEKTFSGQTQPEKIDVSEPLPASTN